MTEDVEKRLEEEQQLVVVRAQVSYLRAGGGFHSSADKTAFLDGVEWLLAQVEGLPELLRERDEWKRLAAETEMERVSRAEVEGLRAALQAIRASGRPRHADIDRIAKDALAAPPSPPSGAPEKEHS